MKAGDKLKNAEPTPYDDNDTLTYYGKSAHAYLLDDKSLKVTSFTLNGKTYAAGEIAKTDIGTFVIHSDGLLKVNGATAVEEAYRYQASYTLSPKDQSGKAAIATLDFTLDNSQNDTLKNHPLNLADVVDGAAHGIQQRRAAPDVVHGGVFQPPLVNEPQQPGGEALAKVVHQAFQTAGCPGCRGGCRNCT
mgnify:CR=1 FL=1